MWWRAVSTSESPIISPWQALERGDLFSNATRKTNVREGSELPVRGDHGHIVESEIIRIARRESMSARSDRSLRLRVDSVLGAICASTTHGTSQALDGVIAHVGNTVHFR